MVLFMISHSMYKSVIKYILDVGKTGNQLRLSLKAVYQKPLRRQRYKHSMQHLPNADLGFTTLARMLPEWIKQAKGETND